MSRYGHMSREWVKWRRGGGYVDNDEGYYWSWCVKERRRTEHESGSCLSCWNKESARRRLDKQREAS